MIFHALKYLVGVAWGAVLGIVFVTFLPLRCPAAETGLKYAGKTTGIPFQEKGDANKTLVGFVIGLYPGPQNAPGGGINWLQPIWEENGKRSLGPIFGDRAMQTIRVEAEPGFAVAGAELRASDGPRGLRLIFARQNEGKLDINERYSSRWVGARGGNDVKWLAANGERALSCEGRSERSFIVGFGLRFGTSYENIPVPQSVSPPSKAPPTKSPIQTYEQALAEVRRWDVPTVMAKRDTGEVIVRLDVSRRTMTPSRLQTIGKLSTLEELVMAPAYAPSLIPDAMGPIRQLKSLRMLDLTGSFWVHDPDLLALRDLPNLSSLGLSQTGITNQGLSQLVGLPLKQLILNSPRIDDAAVDSLIKFPELERLSLYATAITNQGLLRLGTLKNLKELRVVSGIISDDGFSVLEQLPNLTQVTMHTDEVTNAAVDSVAQLKLESLTIGGPMDDHALSKLKNQTELKDLVLADMHVTDEGLANLRQATKLKTVTFRNCHWEDSEMSFNLPLSVTQLTVHGCPISDQDAAGIGRLTKLKSLEIRGGSLTSAAALHWSKLLELENLQVVQSKFDDSAVVLLAKLPQLHRLNLVAAPLTGKGFSAFENSKSLRVLGLVNTQLNDEGMAAVINLENLQALNVSNTRVTSRGLAGISRLKNLSQFEAAGIVASDVLFDELARMTLLTGLDLDGWSVEDKHLTKLLPLKSLKQLALSRTGVTNAGVASLDGLSALQEVYVIGTAITRSGHARFRQSHPFIEIWNSSDTPARW